MTQDQLADATGFARSTINNIERNSQRPQIDFLVKFAETTHISLDELLGVQQEIADKTIGNLVESISKQLSATEQKQLKDYIAQLEQTTKDQESAYQELKAKHEKLLNHLQELREKFSSFFS